MRCLRGLCVLAAIAMTAEVATATMLRAQLGSEAGAAAVMAAAAGERASVGVKVRQWNTANSVPLCNENPPRLVYNGAAYPKVCGNVLSYEAVHGQIQLNRDPAGAAGRRASHANLAVADAHLAHITYFNCHPGGANAEAGCAVGTQCDEFPPAIAAEGGTRVPPQGTALAAHMVAATSCVPGGENGSAGTYLTHFFRACGSDQFEVTCASGDAYKAVQEMWLKAQEDKGKPAGPDGDSAMLVEN